jgi:hypothetical protein
MFSSMSKGGEYRGTGRLPGEDLMSNKTPVVPSTEGPPTHGHKDELAAEELASPESTATCFPNITETREVVNMDSSESEEMKNSGEGPPTHGHRDELTAEE